VGRSAARRQPNGTRGNDRACDQRLAVHGRTRYGDKRAQGPAGVVPERSRRRACRPLSGSAISSLTAERPTVVVGRGASAPGVRIAARP
jgi:hypothetical protein